MRTGTDSDAVLRTLQDYVGLKLHFTGDLVFRRDMKFRFDESTLMKRKDAFMFYAMVDKEPDREVRLQRLISGFKMNPKMWIGEIEDMELKEYHKQRMRIIGALKYSFRTDVERIVRYMEENKVGVRELLRADNGMAPHIITHMDEIDGGVTDETLSLLDKAFKYTKFDASDPLWEDKRFMISKYHYWLDIEGEFLKQQLSKIIEAK